MVSNDDYTRARLAMVSDQLARRGIHDARVLEAMSRIPREKFVDADPADVYADRALTIACGQTISQPYMVALMSQALELDKAHRVLEVGTGSGYQTAILAELANQVFSIERHSWLSELAAANLAALGYANVQLRVGDGTSGWSDAAPFDRILVTAAAAECPAALFEQLTDEGLLVIPVGDCAGQVLQCIRKRAGGQQKIVNLAGCRFVPLIGASQPREVSGE